MVDLEKEAKHEGQAFKNFFHKKKFWMSLSIALAVILVLVLIWPSGMSSGKAGTALVASLNERTGGGVTLKNISSMGNLYAVNVVYQNQEIPVYMTRDGKYMVMGVQELTPSNTTDTSNTNTDTNTQPKEVPKTAKPVVEAFVFAYCPYGLQFEKALSPVYTLLKNKADINIVYIGAMHGDFEKTESLRQLCIQKNYGKDKLWAYLNKFFVDTNIGACNGDAACLTPLLSKIYSSTGIDSTKIDSCMTSDALALYQTDTDRAASLGISGSPDFVINGVETSVARNPDAIKTAICDAFTTAPAECSQTLSTASATPSFGSGSSTSSSTASC